MTAKGHFRSSIEPLEHVTHVMCASSKGQLTVSMLSQTIIALVGTKRYGSLLIFRLLYVAENHEKVSSGGGSCLPKFKRKNGQPHAEKGG